MADTVRLDKWLWATRLYKTRSLAAKDASANKVKRDTRALKPAAAIKIGDLLEVPSHDGTHKKQIEVVQLIDKRVGAPLAREAYRDLTAADVLAEATRRKEDQKANRQLRKEGDQGRLNKKQRRAWNRGLHQFGEPEQPSN
ncbi:RNA-binding S4 domain-containing protein [Persicirhabdus sediminis]|uniref:RNA-binding S4 domain-containing protein n=1 Tax=Persicirhabdus sediminis TaxID=454144 RepID=A0A8J7MEZ4_9BACT|nr:S4 domain-containing protein [Persicirhabdus sediminis]MBK1792126.1 hypothetical protein [Persicirhabdus sediminis]